MLRSTRMRWLIAAFFAWVALLIGLEIGAMRTPFDVSPQRHYRMPKYIAPIGCTEIKVSKRAIIPRTCASGDNIIGNSYSLGFRTHHRNDNWIRIGNDAIDAQCRFVDCLVIYVAGDKFYQIPSADTR